MRDVMLPPGLGGAHSKNFIVLDGVPRPRGDPGHSCIFFMDGFTASDPRCHPGSVAIEFLQSIDLDTDLSACRLLQPSPRAAIEAVAIYDPGKRPRPGEGPAPPVDVPVQKPGDVVLVLDDLGPVKWQIRPARGTRIVGVLMTGHYKSSVEGVPPDTPVVSIDHETRGQRPKPDPACAPFLNYVGTAYFGGPAVVALDAQVKAWTGRGIDGFRSGYSRKEVEIR